MSSKPMGTTRYAGPSAWSHRVEADPLALQIDTARTYSGGTSEEYLGKIDWKKRGEAWRATSIKPLSIQFMSGTP